MPSLLISDAEPGIGPIKSVFPALTDGYSTTKRFVLPFLTNAPPMTLQELASLATKDMTSRMEPVSSLPQTMPTHLTSDAEPGTGKTKSVLPALTNGSSMTKRFVFQLPTNVPLMMSTETA